MMKKKNYHNRLRDRELEGFIGLQMRTFRTQRGMTQEALAEVLGLSHQQVQKYEVGANRINVVILHKMAQIFDVSVVDFFPPRDSAPKVDIPHGGRHRQMIALHEDMSKISKPVQQAIHELVRTLAKHGIAPKDLAA